MARFGPSGAGKSPTLKAIRGLLRPEADHVRLGGMTLFDAGQGVNLPLQQRSLGHLFRGYEAQRHPPFKHDSFSISCAYLGGDQEGCRDAQESEIS